MFGYTSPTTAEHVAAQLDGEYDLLIDGGACRVGLEATVLSLINDTPILLCPGGISVKDIENVIGPVEILSKNGNLREASVNLYAAMRRLDSLNLKLIATHLFPDSGMGIAINNRMVKAAGGKISEIPV